ncbi:MAG: endonuclease/exonuclease/phosphatase family protein [Phycisphaerae bacterium]|nr:endonuclease/exonuclease/phosphatase family protein [Phycisphaerae bacterium]
MTHTRRCFVASALAALALTVLPGCQTGSVKLHTPGTLRVLSYNIHHGEAMDKKFDYQRLAKVINDLSPDIVALQEVDVGTERASGVNQAALLGKLCKMHHAFGQAMPYQGGQYGEAILSRFPIEKVLVHPLPYEFEQEPRAALEVRIKPDGIGPIAFVGTHLCHQKVENRVQQTQRISRLFSKQEGGPVILAGDFNSRPGRESMKVLLDAGWIDAVAPRSVIDYVLLRSCDPWKVKEVTIVDEPVVSDHNPVLVDLQWQGDGPHG